MKPKILSLSNMLNVILPVAFTMVLLFGDLRAATITSFSDGNFDDDATWVGGVAPTSTDDAIINSDHGVDVVNDGEVGSLTVYSNNDGDFTIFEIAAGVTLTVNGNVYIHSDGAVALDEPLSQIRLRGTLIVKGDLIFETHPGSDPSLAHLKMTYTGGSLVLYQNVTMLGKGGFIDALDSRETTVSLVGSNAQSLTVTNSTEFYNLIFANTSAGGVSLGGNLNSSNIYGDITIQSGKFQNSGYTISGIGGFDFTVSNGATYILGGTTTLPTNFNHVFASGCIIEYGGTNQTIGTPNNSQNYHHLTISGSGTKSLAANLTVNGNLTLNSATLDVTASNYSIDLKGNWVNGGGTFNARSGAVTFSGTSPSLSTTTTFTSVVQISTGTTLTTNGNLILASGASLMHGTGTPGGGGSVSGNVIVKRTGNSGSTSYNFWSAPISNASIGSYGNGHRYYYDPSNATNMTVDGLRDGWVAASGVMTPGVGYIFTGGGTASFGGTVNNAPTGSPITVNVTKNVGTSNGVPYNLIGNPFPSAIDAASFMAVNGPAGNNVITGSLYFWDDDGTFGANYSNADYAVWSGAGSVVGPNNGTVFNGYIASGQSFFVEKIANGTSSVEFRNSMRSTSNNAFFKTAPVQRLWVSLTGANDQYNEVLIAFMDDATDTLDLLYDARKLKGNAALSLFTKLNEEDFAIQALSLLTEDKTVDLGIDIASSGTYALHLKQIENLDETVSVILEDTETGTFQNLRSNSDYVFSVNSGTDIQRFKLHFNPALEISASNETCATDDGKITLNQIGNYHWNYIVTDSEGNLIGTGTDLNGAIDFQNLNAGEYSIALSDSYGYQANKTAHVGAVTPVIAQFKIDQEDPACNAPVGFINLSEGAVDYFWDMGDGTVLNSVENPTHTYSAPGIYNILLRASNYDCSDEFIRQVEVNGVGTGVTFAENSNPSIYSLNDKIFFDFKGMDQSNAQISIYNSAGQRVYSANVPATGIQSIELSAHSAAFYLVVAEIRNSRFEQKVILN